MSTRSSLSCAKFFDQSKVIITPRKTGSPDLKKMTTTTTQFKLTSLISRDPVEEKRKEEMRKVEDQREKKKS